MKTTLRGTLGMTLLLLVACATASAQEAGWTRAREEIHRDIRLSASNFTAYQDPVDTLTPTPPGYEPFYLTHYGRHGSRWLLEKSEYADALGVMRRGHDAGALTERGELLLRQLEDIYKEAEGRRGELTSVGEQQHHRIGKRMAELFPEIFCQPETQVDARATVVIRCILSMTAASEELAAANPQARIHNDVSRTFQYYLNADWSDRATADNSARKRAVSLNHDTQFINPERFWKQLFLDANYRDTKLSSRREVMKKLFYICGNQQSHEPYLSLYDLFTEEECYDLWRCENISWYVDYAQGTAPFTQAALLRNIIATADTIVDNKAFRGATLRYGHEVCLLPLAALLELGGCYPEVPAEGLDTLDRVWANFRIFPMGCNIQLLFYRPVSGKGDVLVKALLNERETTLPAAPVEGPYYSWRELRAYYLKKLDDYEQGNL
ncbi:MAG: histidine-type phosphatase [Prevotellaceae bacterium]|nr:histidine-type phosphatase [Prevotellaceae bacterium]